jgi:hypothetical protein
VDRQQSLQADQWTNMAAIQILLIIITMHIGRRCPYTDRGVGRVGSVAANEKGSMGGAGLTQSSKIKLK